MNKSLLIGLLIGAGSVAGMGAVATLMKDEREAPIPTLVDEQTIAPAAEDSETPAVSEAPAPSALEIPQQVAVAPVPAPPPAPRVVNAVRTGPEYARVVSVQPLTRTVSEPREICQDVEVTEQAPIRDEHQVAGTVIGGVIGGVIGNQIGDGSGRKIAKVAGALGGAYAGNKVQERIQNSRTVTRLETQCHTVYESRELPDGYNVTYEWNGSTRTVKMERDPGSQLPVRGGEVVLAANAR